MGEGSVSGGDIRVVVADDQEIVRLGLRGLISAEEGLEVVGVAADGLEAVAVVREVRPDVVLMDIRMPGIDGLTALRRISDDPELGGTRVVVLTTFGHDEYVFEALAAGAAGFLLKDAPPVQLLEAVRRAADGGALLDPEVTRAVVQEFVARGGRTTKPHPELGRLTEREREVMVLVAEGLSNDGIAQRLGMSSATARTHVSRAMTKLSARDRAQLVVFAYQSGLMR